MGHRDGEMVAWTTSQYVLRGLRAQRQQNCWVNRKILDGRGEGWGCRGTRILVSPPGAGTPWSEPLAPLQVNELTGWAWPQTQKGEKWIRIQIPVLGSSGWRHC